MSGDVSTVRNKHLGPTVYTDESAGGKVPYEWAGYQDHNEGDYQEVPEHVIKQPAFRKALSRGVFEVINNDDTDARLYSSGQNWQDARSQSMNDIEATLDRNQVKDIIAKPCIGPGPNNTECGAGVVMSNNSSAPLCSAHKHLASSYALSSDESGKDKWVRANFTKRNQVD